MILAWLVGCGLFGSPAEVWPDPGTPVRARSVVTGGSTTCAHLDDGRVACWGSGEAGELGREVPLDCVVQLEENHTASRACSAAPVPIEGLGPVDEVSVGGGHVCVLAGGDVHCWGGNGLGALGTATWTTCHLPYPGLHRSPCRYEPAKVPDLPKVSAVSAGTEHTCALTEDGRAYCWGGSGLGVSPTERCTDVAGGQGPCMPPTEVPGVPPLASIAAGTETTCAIDRDGGLWCWGQNELGKLGDGSGQDRVAPVKLDLPAPATEVALGSSHGCALAGGEAWCWGSSWHQETGTPGSEACPARMGARELGFHVPCEPSPVRVPGVSGAVGLSVSGANSCVQVSGQAVCWGWNGPGLPKERTGSGPRPVGAMHRTALGNQFACGVIDGVVHCIGDDKAHAHGATAPLTHPTPLAWSP